MKRILITSLFLAACGGGSAPAPGPTEPAPTEHHEEGGGERRMLPAPLRAFHDVLAPLWHAEAGPARADSTCAAVADLKAKAADLVNTPEDQLKNKPAFASGIGDLESALNGLDTACQAPGRPDFDGAFTKVHEQFHFLLEQLQTAD